MFTFTISANILEMYSRVWIPEQEQNEVKGNPL